MIRAASSRTTAMPPLGYLIKEGFFMICEDEGVTIKSLKVMISPIKEGICV